MKNFCCVLLWSAAAIILAQSSSAAVFSRDWKTPGDGLLTYDDVNKREWLDLSQTILSSQFPGADPSPQVTREDRYQYVLSQTNTGGLFEGFTVAKRTDVIALAQSAGIDTSTLSPATNSGAALSLGQLLGFTYMAQNGFNVASGLLNEPPSPQHDPPIRPDAEIYSSTNQAGLLIVEGHFQFPTPPGVMLFRSIPEPSSIALLLLGACMVAVLRALP